MYVSRSSVNISRFDIIRYDIIDIDCFLVRNENHGDCDCISIFILTHGSDGGTVSASDMPYPLQSIWMQFTADNCPTLASKPKLFFIQVNDI